MIATGFRGSGGIQTLRFQTSHHVPHYRAQRLSLKITSDTTKSRQASDPQKIHKYLVCYCTLRPCPRIPGSCINPVNKIPQVNHRRIVPNAPRIPMVHAATSLPDKLGVIQHIRSFVDPQSHPSSGVLRLTRNPRSSTRQNSRQHAPFE
jgi:hypothetical protein